MSQSSTAENSAQTFGPQVPEHDNEASQVREAQKVGRLSFVTADQASKILKLNKEALEYGAPFEIPQLAPVRGQRVLD